MNILSKLKSLYKEPTYLVAVYGSLRKDLGNHSLLGTSEFVGKGVTKSPKFAMLSLSAYPMVMANTSRYAHPVVEVYRVDKQTLKGLDALEGHPSFYCRKETTIMIDGEVALTCWMYIGSEDYIERFKLGSSTIVPRMDNGTAYVQDWKKYYQAKKAGTLKTITKTGWS